MNGCRRRGLFIFFSLIVPIFTVLLSPEPSSSKQELPEVDGKAVVATVNGEPIFLEELNEEIASAHAARPEGMKAGRVDYSSIMGRLINTRLIMIEAKNIGLDELPEIQALVKQFSKETLMEMLLEKRVGGIAADEAAVDERYREIVREWELKSAKFKNEADVKRIEAELEGGGEFDAVMAKAVSAGIAELDETSQVIKDEDLTPSVARLISELEVGSVSPIVNAGQEGFILFKLEGVRYPETENAKVRSQARREMLDRARVKAARDYVSELKKMYLTLDEARFDALDYESKEPGFENLLKDTGVIAEISGEEPITVSEFSKKLKQKFYHGIDRAIESGTVNKSKNEIFEDLVQRRLLLKEARLQGLDQTVAYREKVVEYRNSITFGAFVEKVVIPEVKIDSSELKAYYEENRETYTLPEMMRIKELVFEKKGEAQAAMDKLLAGADFKWVSSHAEGQLAERGGRILSFDGKLVTVTSLPEGVRKAVSGAKPGDFKLYESPAGHFYVLYTYHVVTPKPRPFDEVKSEIAEAVFLEKQKKVLEDWAHKLREHYPVKVHRKDLE